MRRITEKDLDAVVSMLNAITEQPAGLKPGITPKEKKMKYFNRFRTKRELLSAIKSAPANDTFFNRDTMRFFGRQAFRIVDRNIGPEGVPFVTLVPVLVIRFLEKCPRSAFYNVDPVTLELQSVVIP